MMDAIVQFLRNFLCCIKDLELLSETWLYDPKITNSYYRFGYPMNQTTPLEAFISIFQAYVVLTGVPKTWQVFWLSYGKLRRIQRLMETVQLPHSHTDCRRLLVASLQKEAKFALRSMFVTFNCFFISWSFCWLTANSWHIVTETNWMGGLPALIHALTVMNICLVPLLYYMYMDCLEQFDKAVKMDRLRVKLQQGTVRESDLGLWTLEALSGWLPFWDSGVSAFGTVDEEQEQSQVKAEAAKLQTIMDDILGTTASNKKDMDAAKIQKQQAEQLQLHVRIVRFEGYREFLYLILNTIACYGYTLCVLVYYWDNEILQPSWLRGVLLGWSNNLADWRGNFAGDFMWTMEPLVILASPLYVNTLQRRKKIKKD